MGTKKFSIRERKNVSVQKKNEEFFSGVKMNKDSLWESMILNSLKLNEIRTKETFLDMSTFYFFKHLPEEDLKQKPYTFSIQHNDSFIVVNKWGEILAEEFIYQIGENQFCVVLKGQLFYELDLDEERMTHLEVRDYLAYLIECEELYIFYHQSKPKTYFLIKEKIS